MYNLIIYGLTGAVDFLLALILNESWALWVPSQPKLKEVKPTKMLWVCLSSIYQQTVTEESLSSLVTTEPIAPQQGKSKSVKAQLTRAYHQRAYIIRLIKWESNLKNSKCLCKHLKAKTHQRNSLANSFGCCSVHSNVYYHHYYYY